MKFFRKIDSYLLYYYPSVWITRAHVFLPLGLGIFALLAFGNILSGWDPKEDMPHRNDGELLSILLLIIPVLIYLVYWFIMQSRYNVTKSHGKMSIGLEYLNYVLYVAVFFVALLIIIAIPMSQQAKMRFSVGRAEVAKDVADLNLGYGFFFDGYEYEHDTSVQFMADGTILFKPKQMITDLLNKDDLSANYTQDGGYIILTRTEAETIITNFIVAHNKYTNEVITHTPQEILEEHKPNNLQYTYPYLTDWTVESKTSTLQSLHFADYRDYSDYTDYDFWKAWFAFFGAMAMLVWIFKQMKLRQFVFGFISICLTPLVLAIVAVVLFEFLRFRENGDLAHLLLLATYAVLGFFVIRAFFKNVLHKTGYVMTMYLQFFLPLLPFIMTTFFSRHLDGDDEEILYWVSWIVGLLSIVAFKPLYTKFGNLPERT